VHVTLDIRLLLALLEAVHERAFWAGWEEGAVAKAEQLALAICGEAEAE
jgi:hypothetical protein